MVDHGLGQWSIVSIVSMVDYGFRPWSTMVSIVNHGSTMVDHEKLNHGYISPGSRVLKLIIHGHVIKPIIAR